MHGLALFGGDRDFAGGFAAYCRRGARKVPTRHESSQGFEFGMVERQSASKIPMKGSMALSACALLLVGCYDSNNTRSLQQHTADATAAAKRSAGAIARGVVEGLTGKGPLDINKASEKDLAQLPSVTPADAQAIIAGRPYVNTSQ